MSATPDSADAVVVGASLAGCTTALLLARAGARVTLVESHEDPRAYKRICGHFIQASAVPTLERLGVLEPIAAAGGVRTRARLRTPWGTIEPPPPEVVPPSVNIRRERLDPMLRELAAAQPGVDLKLGLTVTALDGDGDRVTGVQVRDRAGRTRRLAAHLVVGADGRASKVAELAGVRERVSPQGRFSYGAYYEGPAPAGAPDGQMWLLDPHWAAAFPTDGGLTMYACMPTKDRLPEFRRDLAGALESFVAGLPDAPPIRESRRVGQVLGKVEMPNVRRGPVAPGLALAGDAALATDPLWGVGCGWAFQMGAWLADSVAGSLAGDQPLSAGLRRYRRRLRRGLAGHDWMIRDYATGRGFSPVERMLFATAVADDRAAERMARFGARIDGPQALMAPGLVGRVAAVQLGGRRRRRMLAPGRRAATL